LARPVDVLYSSLFRLTTCFIVVCRIITRLQSHKSHILSMNSNESKTVCKIDSENYDNVVLADV